MTERRGRAGRWVGAALLPVLVAACAPSATVVLLPEKDGRKTAVTVTQGDNKVVLDEPYAAAKVSGQGPIGYKSTPQEVERIAGPAIASQPPRPTRFTLYFIEGKEEFTPESKQVVDSVFAEIAKRPLPDIVVIGHTDLTGTDQFNDALGQRRADLVKAELVERLKIPADKIQASSRGKREPAVQTASGVAEARNRRVEIIVR